LSAEECERILAAEGMPAELPDLPTSWTTYDPVSDGRVTGDQVNRRRGHKAARWALEGMATRAAYDEAAALVHDPKVSKRERQVMTLFCEGFGRPTIARKLNITEGAVREVFRKARSRHGITTVPRRKQWRPRRPPVESESTMSTKTTKPGPPPAALAVIPAADGNSAWVSMAMDQETSLLARTVTDLQALDEDQRRRVLDYLQARFATVTRIASAA
jgi:hypothetical protein